MIARSGFRAVLIAGAAFAASAHAAFAQGIDGVDFADSEQTLQQQQGALDLTLTEGSVPYIASSLSPGESPAPVRLELELAAGGGDAPFDVAIAQRATLGSGGDGEIERRGSGSELRIGQGLVGRRETGDSDAVYMFIASDDEALTWRPGERSNRGLALQDQVEVGDISAGVTIERSGVQASIAYVEREENTQVGVQSFTQSESFAGVTVTVRH
jgi:hypothetical protein